MLGGFHGYAPSDDDRAKGRAVNRATAQARAAGLLPLVQELRTAGATSYHKLAAELNRRGVPAPRGGAWFAASVRQVLRHAPAR